MIDIENIKKSKTTAELLKFSIINIDKPSGPTSFSVSDYIRKSLKLSKTSHLGTLDPSVSGVLPIALSRACRLNEYLMHKNKTYIGIMHLHRDVLDSDLHNAIKKYLGKIKQLPPVRSSVKREIRERFVHSFKILERDDGDVLFETEVQAGTYVRTLCVDIGKEIGGAHMLELRRKKAGLFDETKSITLYDFDKIVEEFNKGNDNKLREILIPGEIVSNFLPVVHIKKQVVKKVLTGSPIFPNFLESENEIKDINENDKICIFAENDFIGCYHFLGPGNVIAKPEFVLN